MFAVHLRTVARRRRPLPRSIGIRALWWEVFRIRRCISAVRTSIVIVLDPEMPCRIENSVDQVAKRIERLIWPSMLCIGWSSPDTPAILDDSRARSSIG